MLYRLLKAFLRWKSVKVKKVFERAEESPVWLGQNELEALQAKYSFPPEYGYDPQSLEQRGKERAKEIIGLIGRRITKINTFLELGCWDGMTSYHLQRMGKSTTAIDKTSEGFDGRAAREGVKFMQMNSADLQFKEESFDFVFSYNAFEHFTEPESVLKEVIRAVKKDGYIYLNFGPLYMAPMGLHAYRSITVPYCQFLFSKKTLEEYVSAKGLKQINFAKINGWSLEDYRKLWTRYDLQLKKIKYNEIFDATHLDLIMKYPSCFRSKTQYFDNLMVSTIEVLFKKIG